MDYSKMTKQELIEKLNEQKHLADAVDAKDREINSLKDELGEAEEKSKNYGSLKFQFETLTEEFDKRTTLLNKYSEVYLSLLKVLQGTVDTHVEINSFLIEKAKEKK